jgi:hypothetical protein
MKKSFIKKAYAGLYQAFLVFMISISMAMNPMLISEIKKMTDYLNEVRIEQVIEEETDEEDPID